MAKNVYKVLPITKSHIEKDHERKDQTRKEIPHELSIIFFHDTDMF